MLRLIITLCFFSIYCCNAQINNNGEFTVYNNGLIYSPVTMNQLTSIVDSLNLKFKRCDLTRPYYAKSQAIGNHLSLEKGNIKEALKDMADNMSFEDFLKKYKNAEADYRMLIVKYRYKESYSDKWVVEFSGETMTDYGGYEIRIEDDPGYYDRPLQGKWIVKYYAKDEYTAESLVAFYITNEFESQKIPEKYASMIMYSDCVIDTTADIFTEKAKRTGLFEEDADKNYRKTKRFAFNNYIEQNTKHITEKTVPAAYGMYKWMALDSMKKAWINQKLVPTEKFKQLLADAVNEAKQKQHATDNEFENYVATYVSKADALELKRNRRVMGMCSMDQSPRYHALNIAMLSAETVNWQVFLRAHLNIMNDRFERASDGSYAWAQRQTYIKELEELNIEVQELLLGISFRIENPVDKHYYGSINRLGRALAETKERVQFENEILNIIKDGGLDAYNRMLMHYLYLNYIYYLPEKEARLASLVKLEEADRSLPDFFRLRIKIDRKNFEKPE
ncbi:MAG TPA: hypothetical protein PKC54_09045 [Ferruginibacter sp.]|nr:hypothetical protein [Ferruginibacter sp.]